MRATPFTSRILVSALFAASGAQAAEEPGAPVIPGLHQNHPLNEYQTGELLISELRCASCHDGMNSSGMKAAPDLQRVGARLNQDYLQNFIANPAAVHSGTTMPNVLASESEEKRLEISKSITNYLLSLNDGGGAREKAPEPDAKAGHELFHQVGCVACHSPRDEAGNETSPDGMISLSHIPGKYRTYALGDFLFDPLKVRPSGRMPDMNLTGEEAASLASYLEGDVVAPAPENRRPTVEEVKAGQSDFKKYNCAACHQLGDSELPATTFGPALGKLNSTRGCLSEQPSAGASPTPDFHLSEVQRKAIRSVLDGPAQPSSKADEIKMRLTQLNCIACHTRGDYGGVSPDRDAFFHSTQEALGNEARIPPPLTLIGAKLRPEWLNKVLYDRESIRPYMLTRMPHFGDSSLAGLPDLFAAVDHIDQVEMPVPERESMPMMNNGGHLLLGDTGLSCIACHNYNGKESPGMQGLDLMTSYQRLQPSWFHQFMLNPAGSRPGIIMPSYWPGGKATQTEILNGDTELQLQALWHQFSLGRSARDPSGLRSSSTKLLVTDQTRTYRGRSKIAGFRGIAVGFPDGMNYAFNAQNGALSGIWQGEFVTANWQSQGAGDFNPIGRPVQLAQDVAFLQLADDQATWPLQPVTNKEAPVNPDPLYPRNHGYAFRGYYFDEANIPTFMYRCGEISIEDKTVTTGIDGKSVLRRTFNFTSPAPSTVYFRVLTGKFESKSENSFKTTDLQLDIAPGETIRRPSGDGQELLIKLDLPTGKSSYTVDYSLLRQDHE